MVCPELEPDHADAKPTEAFELGGGDQISIPVKAQQPKCARTENTDDRPAPGIVDPPDRLGRHLRRRRRSKPLQPRPLLAHIVDELDPWVGSQLRQESLIGGIVGGEDYAIAPLCIIEA